VIDKKKLNVHNTLGAADSNPPFCIQWRIGAQLCCFACQRIRHTWNRMYAFGNPRGNQAKEQASVSTAY
jgi:hypothetical protein